MVINVGINGFGRVGRVVFRTCMLQADIKIVAINDPAVTVDYISYLMRFDSTHGKFNGEISYSGDEIVINGKPIKIFNKKSPNNVPWHTVGVHYVIEASGMFSNLEKASGHLQSDGVRRVIVTAPSVDVPMIILGVNDIKLSPGQKVVSCGSSTLYCLAPIMKILQDNFGVEDSFVTSIHAMTPSLKPLDGLCLRGKHWRDHRSIHQNIIPATTGACKALGKIIPAMKDKMAGLAFRVPIVNVSVLDITVRLSKETTMEEIIKVVDEQSRSSLENILTLSNEQAVSSDFSEDSHSCILDINSSIGLKPDYYKLVCWYENEFSYACRVVDLIYFSEKQYNNKMAVGKLDSQQTYFCNKRSLIEGSCPPKIVSSSSRTTDFKGKHTQRPVTLRKHFTQNNLPLRSSSNHRVPKKTAEIFKVWNDDDIETTPCAVKQNRNSFFQSCITFNKSTPNECIKAQERLEKVKLEFSKMVHMTEELLKKSYITKSKVKNNSDRTDSATYKISDTTSISKETDDRTSKKDSEINKYLEKSEVFDGSGQTKKASVSTLNSKTITGVDSTFSYEQDMSEYSVAVGSTQNSVKQHINPVTKSMIVENKQQYCSKPVNISDINNLSNLNKKNFEKITKQLVEDNNINDFKEQVTRKVDSIMDGITKKVTLPRFDGNTGDSKDSNAEHYSKNKKDTTSIRDSKITTRKNVQNDLNKNISTHKSSKNGINAKLAQSLEGINCLSSQLACDFNRNIVDANCINKTLKKHNIVLINYLHGDDAAYDSNRIDNSKENNDLTFGNKEKTDKVKKYNFNTKDEEESNKNLKDCQFLDMRKEIETLVDSGKRSPDFISTRGSTQESTDENIEKVYTSAITFHEDDESMLDVGNERQKDDQHELVTASSLISSNLTLECHSLCSCPNKNNDIKQDIYDKLDSTSATDSGTSLNIDKRKSQVIDIKDLTNSLEDLARLDKICRIIEISDELSDKLFAPIANDKDTQTKTRNKWSFKDLCEKINLDEFCNKVFNNSVSRSVVP